jgi:hypothetical protein
MDVSEIGRGAPPAGHVVDWKAAELPPVCPDGRQVQVLGVIADPALCSAGDEAFVDVVTWWPDRKEWTVTHCSRASRDATDYPTVVTHWDWLPPVPSAAHECAETIR